MPDYVAAFTCDNHVSSTDSAWASSAVKGDARNAVDQFVEFCVEYRVPAFFLGDQNDRTTVRSRVPYYWLAVLYRLQDAKVPCHFLQGNHDCDDPPMLAGHRNAVHLHRKAFPVGPFKGYAFDYQHQDKLGDELDRIPAGTDVLLCHQGWEEFLGVEGRYQGSFRQVPVVPMLVTGDFHETHVKEFPGKDGQQITVVSPGSGCMQAINEPEEKFFVAMDSGGGFHPIPIKSRRVVRVGQVNREEELTAALNRLPARVEQARNDAIQDDLPEELWTPLVHVAYSAAVPGVVRRVTKTVGSTAAHFFWTEVRPEQQAESEDAPLARYRKGEAVTPLSCLGRVLDADRYPKSYALVKRLLSANDPKRELSIWKDEVLEGK